MRRLYKVILILFIGFILTIIIYYYTIPKNLNYLALGDGIASGENAYLIDGNSYNDYFNEEQYKKIKLYNDDFTKKNYKLKELIDDIKKNTQINDNYIEQLIHNSNIITIAIGMDELAKFSVTDKLDQDYIKDFLDSYDILLYLIRKLNDKEVIILGLYKANNLKESDIILINSQLKDIAKKYNSKYIDISELLKDKSYFLKDNSYYFDYNAHYKIYQMIKYSLN